MFGCVEFFLAFFTFVSFPRMRHKDAFVSRALPKLNTTEIDISSKKNADLRRRRRRRIMGGKKISGARKRKKKKEKEEAAKEAAADMERLKLGPTKLWTGLVVHHKDVFVSHVLSKLNRTDRCFFSKVNRESLGVLEYAGVDVSKLSWLFTNVHPFRRWNGRGITCPGERKIRWKSDRSSLVLLASCWNEQTRVSQVGERSETLRVG